MESLRDTRFARLHARLRTRTRMHSLISLPSSLPSTNHSDVCRGQRQGYPDGGEKIGPGARMEDPLCKHFQVGVVIHVEVTMGDEVESGTTSVLLVGAMKRRGLPVASAIRPRHS